MSSVPWSEVTILEEKLETWISHRRDLIERVSSELQASANPPLLYSGKGQKRKNANLALERYEKGEYVLKFKKKKLPYCVIFSLACQSWFYPQLIRTAVQFLILEERKRWNFCHEELDVVLQDKATCLLFLQEQVHLKGWNWLFGSIITDKWTVRLKQGNHYSFYLYDVLPKYFYQIKKRPRPGQRKRGYRDHGSLGDLNVRARREEQSKDFSSLQEEENYRKREWEHQGIIDFLKGWFS